MATQITSYAELSLDFTATVDRDVHHDGPSDWLVEDVTCEGLALEKEMQSRDGAAWRKWTRTWNLMAGVDLRSKDVQRLLQNIADAYGEAYDLDCEFIDAAADDDRGAEDYWADSRVQDAQIAEAHGKVL